MPLTTTTTTTTTRAVPCDPSDRLTRARRRYVTHTQTEQAASHRERGGCPPPYAFHP